MGKTNRREANRTAMQKSTRGPGGLEVRRSAGVRAGRGVRRRPGRRRRGLRLRGRPPAFEDAHEYRFIAHDDVSSKKFNIVSSCLFFARFVYRSEA